MDQGWYDSALLFRVKNGDAVSLVTRNRKHFERVPGVEVVSSEPWSSRCLTVIPRAG